MIKNNFCKHDEKWFDATVQIIKEMVEEKDIQGLVNALLSEESKNQRLKEKVDGLERKIIDIRNGLIK